MFNLGFEMQHQNMQCFCLNSPLLVSSLCVSRLAVPRESGSPSSLPALGCDGDPQLGTAAQLLTTLFVPFFETALRLWPAVCITTGQSCRGNRVGSRAREAWDGEPLIRQGWLTVKILQRSQVTAPVIDIRQMHARLGFMEG